VLVGVVAVELVVVVVVVGGGVVVVCVVVEFVLLVVDDVVDWVEVEVVVFVPPQALVARLPTVDAH
jgi:hypothetical protein